MAFRRANFDADVKRLVETLSGFKEGDENQEICMNYIQSNLNYHRFLDPDSHKIKRAISGTAVDHDLETMTPEGLDNDDGFVSCCLPLLLSVLLDGLCDLQIYSLPDDQSLADKFRVHSQLMKAETLQNLVAEFMNTVEDDSPTNVDCHYAMLSLLLLLSDHPTQSEFVGQARKAPSPEEEIDWAAILMEGEEIQRVFPESPEWSDLEDEDEGKNDEAVPIPARNQGAGDADDGFHEEDVPPSDSGLSSQHSSRLPFSSDDKGASWLNDNVVEQYWCHPLSSTEVSNDTRSMQLAQQWADYSFSSQIPAPSASYIVLEKYIVREILWMLNGTEKLHLFRMYDEKFCPVQNISVSHLTAESLHSLLEEICQVGTIVHRFQRFCTKMTEPFLMVDGSRSDVRTCRTYLAFATSVHSYLAEFKAKLCDMEKACTENGLLLSSLYQSLKTWFKQLSLLDELFTDSVDVDGHDNHAERAESLLRNMNRMLHVLDGFGELRVDGISLLLPMYLETMRPYLHMMDQLITVGRVDDHTNEFIVQRDASIKAIDENFWSEAYRLATDTRREPSASGQTSGATSAHSADGGAPTGARSSDDGPARKPAPVFAAVLEDLILTGKSMEILHHLGRLSDVYNPEYESLYLSLVTELTSLETAKNGDRVNNVITSLDSGNEDDRLLLANFKLLLNLNYFDQEQNTKYRVKSFCFGLPSASLGSWPLTKRMDDILVQCVSARCQHVSKTLYRILVDEYDALVHLDNVRRYFLMEAGDIMYDFYTDIFEKLRNQDNWCDVSYLTVLLQDCLSQHRKQCRLFVRVDQSQSARRQPINALDCLSLVYDVAWPVSIVIGRRCQRVYNSIFTWLLQIKRAKYCLDQLHYREFCGRRQPDVLTSSVEYALDHRIQLFRMKLMNFVNALHNYIMAGVLNSKGLEFNVSLTQTSDVAQLLDLHTSFLSQIHTECLLSRNLILLKEAASKVLNMCIVFQARMENEGLTRLNKTDLSVLEADLSRCLQFMSSFLHNLTKHSSAPHLECLEASVVETLKI